MRTVRWARRCWLGLTLAAVAYIPLLLSSPGRISADTKAYLYLDPGRLLDRAWLMWNTHVNGGTVVHQNIGYMFPLGPYYWLMRFVGVPTWIAERLMFGTILFAAGYGTVWMLRRLGLRCGPRCRNCVIAGRSRRLLHYLSLRLLPGMKLRGGHRCGARAAARRVRAARRGGEEGGARRRDRQRVVGRVREGLR